MKVKIKVTRECIKKGRPHDINYCPIAYAARNAGLTRVSVEGDVIIARNKDFSLPACAYKFMDNFDAGKVVKPFSFVAKQITY